jgi:hypothetical protein
MRFSTGSHCRDFTFGNNSARSGIAQFDWRACVGGSFADWIVVEPTSRTRAPSLKTVWSL